MFDATESRLPEVPPDAVDEPEAGQPLLPPPPSLTPAYAVPPAPAPAPAAPRVFPPTWALLLIVMGVLLVIVAAVGTLLTNQRARPTGGAEPQVVDKLATFVSPPTLPAGLAVLQENGNPLPASIPLSLRLREQDFVVVPVTLEERRWPIPASPADGQTVWIYGTVVNYVIGIPASEMTESLLAGLDSTARITVTLNNGVQLVFGSPQARRLPANDTSALGQERPGLTLVLLGGTASDRLIVQARYLPEEGVTAGNAQRVSTVQVAVADSGVVSEGSALRYFVVEYEVTNTGTEPVDPNLFDMALEDGLGQRYAINAEATASGETGPLLTLIPAGNSASGSAGYQVPRDLTPPLTWLFRADPTSGETARFSLPYQPPAPAPGQPQVELTGAFVDGRRDVIVINGVARNIGESALQVSFESIKLTSSAGPSVLQASTPALPWTLPGGGQQLFELQFSRPAGVSSVLLDMLGFTFQIEGLP